MSLMHGDRRGILILAIETTPYPNYTPQPPSRNRLGKQAAPIRKSRRWVASWLQRRLRRKSISHCEIKICQWENLISHWQIEIYRANDV